MSALGSSWDARRTELELPEEIDLQVELANAGSRSLAILVDIGLGGLVIMAFYAVMMICARNFADDWLTRMSSTALEIIVLLLIFGFLWVYFNFFEWLWNGQTPGKRLLNLRVIKADGSPVSLIDVLLRNLSRPVDMFFIGLLLIFVSRRAQRLGDLMAQTLVIHETKIDWSIFDEIEKPGGPTAPSIHLSPPQWELLHRYLNRRNQLEVESRERIAWSIYEALKPVSQGTDLALSKLAPEPWLVELARRT